MKYFVYMELPLGKRGLFDGAGTAYPCGVHEFIQRFLVGVVLLNF
jgi:hypothetical protein